jgi:hypothetical protein
MTRVSLLLDSQGNGGSEDLAHAVWLDTRGAFMSLTPQRDV